MDEEDDGVEALSEAMRRAEEQLSRLAGGPAVDAARAIDEVFERTGRSIEASLTRAARTGELAFSDMARSVASALAELAVERVVQGPLTRLLENVPFLGQRADGGFVTPGNAYLVGERGPEVFVPAAAGSIESNVGRPVTVNIHVGRSDDGSALQRSRGQIASLVARAVARGNGSL